METLAIENVDQLGKVALQMFNSTGTRWWFRGQRNAEWSLLPKIKRGYPKGVEQYMTHEFSTRAHMRYTRCPNDVDHGGWLALMQHYGLPTRLLDWTFSPLVAAYFATKFPFDSGTAAEPTDAIIWALAPTRLNVSQGYKPLYPPLNARVVQQLVRPARKGDDASKMGVLAVTPLETDLKMLTQQGAFTVHVIDTPLNQLPNCSDWLKRVIIPAQGVAGMARELDVLGVRLADLFPDLQSLAKEITNMYPPS